MKSDIFYWMLNMSLHGGLLCLAVLLLRRIRRLPRGFVYGLWSLPCLRLLLPVGINSPLSMMRLLERLGTRRVTEYRILPDGLSSSMNSIGFAQSYAPVTYETNVLTATMETLTLLWLIVACGCLLAAGILYLCTRDVLKDLQPGDGYFRSKNITAPVLYGILRPKILLPAELSPEALPYILRHEAVHRRRGDNLWRGLAIFTCCLHWFNPLCWLSLKYFWEDMELSCDAAVVKELGETEKKAYALALLNTVQERNLFVSGFGGAGLRLRVERVLAYRRLTALSALAFAALFAVIALVLATN